MRRHPPRPKPPVEWRLEWEMHPLPAAVAWSMCWPSNDTVRVRSPRGSEGTTRPPVNSSPGTGVVEVGTAQWRVVELTSVADDLHTSPVAVDWNTQRGEGVVGHTREPLPPLALVEFDHQEEGWGRAAALSGE